MGEVFRARDTRLDRSVAIKVLPAAYSTDAQLKSRFEREAKAISQLNHPHICALFDIGNQNGTDYLVMELLEGQTLAERLARGPLPLADVIRYGVQIAEALERAHRSGIVHRDLKPQNVMITKAGAKLLDFGLAKSVTVDLGADGPTVRQITREGTIVGTFHYMSPEQLEGHPVDQRSDIFALGALLYEMVTGQRAFGGATKTSVISAIVSGEPAAISDLQPPMLEQLIRACLAKDPDARVQSGHDVALQLQWIQREQRPAEAGRYTSLAWGIVAGLAVMLVGGIAYYLRSREVRQALRFNVAAPPNTNIEGAPAISPDGRRIALRTVAVDGSSMLWLRSLDSLDARALKGTEGVTHAFWSPDGKEIGFIARGKLWRLDPADGALRTIYQPMEDPPGGATWNSRDVILFAPRTEGSLLRISASGGAATPVAGTEGQVAYWPSFLPDGDHFLYCREYAADGSNGIYVGSLSSKETRRVVAEESPFTISRPLYAAGNLYYVLRSSLYAQPFDAKKGEVRGEAVKIDDDVQSAAPGRAAFSVSDAGSLVYRKSGSSLVSQFLLADRAGQKVATMGGLAPYRTFELSPDEKQVAFTRMDESLTIWILDRERGTSTRAALEEWAWNPIWMADNRSLVYTAAMSGPPNVYLRRANAPSECLRRTDLQNWATSVTPDGRFAIYDHDDPKTKFDIYAIPIAPPRTPLPIVTAPFRERDGMVSPDGKWLAYDSDESGTREIYAVAFPSGAGRVQISHMGGVTPRWSRDGRELFYFQPDAKRLMAVKIATSQGELRPSAPAPLFALPSALFDVTRDGRFLITEDRLNADAPGLTVVMK